MTAIAMRVICRRSFACMLLLLAACGQPSTPADAAHDDDGGSAAHVASESPTRGLRMDAAAMLRAFPLAKKGEGRARLPSLYASFGKLGETPTHEDIIDNNRSINWPV